MHHRHPLGDAKCDVHVVLDEDQRDVPIETERRSVKSCRSPREPGRRLVEHQDFRLGGERHRERDLPVLAVRQRADELAKLVVDCDLPRGETGKLPQFAFAAR